MSDNRGMNYASNLNLTECLQHEICGKIHFAMAAILNFKVAAYKYAPVPQNFRKSCIRMSDRMNMIPARNFNLLQCLQRTLDMGQNTFC